MKIEPDKPIRRLAGSASGRTFSLETMCFPDPGEPVDPFGALAAWRQNETHGQQKVRWHRDAFPLKVTAEGPDNMGRYVFGVIRDWEAASGGLIRLMFVHPDSGVETIRFRWSDEPTVGRENEVGHTSRKVQGKGWITYAEITLLKNPAIDAELDESRQLRRLRATVLHEFGHALGLEHATDERSVMHHRGWKNAHLTPADIQSLLEIYQGEDFSLSI